MLVFAKQFTAVLAISLTILGVTGCQTQQEYYTQEKPDQNKAELAALTLPDEFEISRVNGKEYETPLVRSDNQHFFFPAGSNQIEFRYKKFWQTGADAHEVVRSLPFLIEAQLSAGHTYRLEYSVPADLAASREFAKKPQIRLLDDGGKTVTFREVPQPSVRAKETAADPAEMLRQWWEKADAAQRREFEQWIKTRP